MFRAKSKGGVFFRQFGAQMLKNIDFHFFRGIPPQYNFFETPCSFYENPLSKLQTLLWIFFCLAVKNTSQQLKLYWNKTSRLYTFSGRWVRFRYTFFIITLKFRSIANFMVAGSENQFFCVLWNDYMRYRKSKYILAIQNLILCI